MLREKMWFPDILDLLWEEPEEVKQKRKELREAREKAFEEWKRKGEESKELAPLGVFSPMLAKSEEDYRAWIESYAKEHPDEEVSGMAIDRENLIYRGLKIVKKEKKIE